jgi:hypothetical protein
MLGDLESEFVVGASRRRRSLGHPYFELIAGSRRLGHQHRKDQKDKVVDKSRNQTDVGLEDEGADDCCEDSGENARSAPTIPERDRDGTQGKRGERQRPGEVDECLCQTESHCHRQQRQPVARSL